MSQVQTLKVRIYTWGRCRHGNVVIVYPEKLNLMNITRLGGKHTVELPYAIINYYNNDSRKNIKRDVEIVPKSRVIVWHYGSGSCNPKSKFNEICVLEPGKEPVKIPVQSEILETEENGYIVTKYIEYAVVNGEKLVLKCEEDRKKKLKVVVSKSEGRATFTGDTYHVREILKSLYCRWNPETRSWILTREDVIARSANKDFEKVYRAIVDELKSIGVEVVEQ